MIAIVHRHKRPSWNFEWNETYESFIFIGRKYEYRIIIDKGISMKPIWIGMHIIESDAWVTVEKEIRASSIVFPYGGRYYFPK